MENSPRPEFRLSRHASEEMARRQIAAEWVDSVLEPPEQSIVQPGGKEMEATVKVKYDPEVDVLTIVLSDVPVHQSDEDKPGVILDYDNNGDVVSIEILEASKRMGDPMSVEYAITAFRKAPAAFRRR